MAAWSPIRHLIGRQYMKAYFNFFPVSAPEEDQDDRNLLYYLAKETMRTLIAKFPEGYEGWAKERGEEPVRRVMSETPMFSTVPSYSKQNLVLFQRSYLSVEEGTGR
ncbi:hypothetical protein N7488_012314 [Penicillium malachiteum]|nr:hypothetical protein N7488_012314 [Penicillium malachiteum]